jgi:hypothetical protein
MKPEQAAETSKAGLPSKPNLGCIQQAVEGNNVSGLAVAITVHPKSFAI